MVMSMDVEIIIRTSRDVAKEIVSLIMQRFQEDIDEIWYPDLEE